MNKTLAFLLLVLFAGGMILGVVAMQPDPITVVKYEKEIFCTDGICDISVLRLYSDGSGAGTSSTVPQEWIKDTKTETSCENGNLVTKTTQYEYGIPVSVASSTNTESPCSQ